MTAVTKLPRCNTCRHYDSIGICHSPFWIELRRVDLSYIGVKDPRAVVYDDVSGLTIGRDFGCIHHELKAAGGV